MLKYTIKNLSEEYDEEGTLDRLNNLIVVCLIITKCFIIITVDIEK